MVEKLSTYKKISYNNKASSLECYGVLIIKAKYLFYEMKLPLLHYLWNDENEGYCTITFKSGKEELPMSVVTD